MSPQSDNGQIGREPFVSHLTVTHFTAGNILVALVSQVGSTLEDRIPAMTSIVYQTSRLRKALQCRQQLFV
jgi:hypothetical protein